MLFVIKAPFMSADLSLVTVLGLSVFWKNVGLLVHGSSKGGQAGPWPSFQSSRYGIALDCRKLLLSNASCVLPKLCLFCRPIFREIGFPWVPVQSHR